jgi:hypothetical protein
MDFSKIPLGSQSFRIEFEECYDGWHCRIYEILGFTEDDWFSEKGFATPEEAFENVIKQIPVKKTHREKG